jgi:hypothetical protein
MRSLCIATIPKYRGAASYAGLAAGAKLSLPISCSVIDSFPFGGCLGTGNVGI